MNSNLKKANEFINLIATEKETFKNFRYYIFKNNKYLNRDNIYYNNNQTLKDIYQDTILNCYDAILKKGFIGDDYLGYFYRSLTLNYINSTKSKSKLVFVEDVLNYEFQTIENLALSDSEPKEITKNDIQKVKNWAKRNLEENEWLFFNEYYFINHQKKSYKQIAKEYKIKHREYIWQFVNNAKSKIKNHFGSLTFIL